jgi:hypothetical protein
MECKYEHSVSLKYSEGAQERTHIMEMQSMHCKPFGFHDKIPKVIKYMIAKLSQI